MQISNVYDFKSTYREDMHVKGFVFGEGEKCACIVGPTRGSEFQQLYICSQLVKKLKELEEAGAIVGGKQIMVIPTENFYAFNLSKSFFGVKNIDLNRCFPGNDYGEPVSRIADGIFKSIKEYSYVIQFTTFFERAKCVPHVRMMDNGKHNVSLANLFGLPYVVVRRPIPIDTTTMNYNLQTDVNKAFTIFTTEDRNIDEKGAKQAISAVLRFLMRMGIIHYECHSGFISHVLYEDDLTDVLSKRAGIFRSIVSCGDDVKYGTKMAEILDPFDGSLREEITASTDGIVFFEHNTALINQYETAFRMIHRLHE